MDATTLLSMLRVFLIVLGGISVVCRIYEMFGGGQQSSSGIKKIIGGIAFGTISAFIMSWAITEIGNVSSSAGLQPGGNTSSGGGTIVKYIPMPSFHSFQGFEW